MANPLPAQSKNEEELRKLSVELRYFEQTAEALQQRLGMMNAATTDLTYAMEALEGIEKEKENAQLLVPVGGSTFIKAKLGSEDKVIVGIGAGVSLEKTLPEAKEIVKQRIEELAKTRVQAEQQLTQVAERINQGRSHMETLLSKLPEGKQ